ncbi:hypothetical protein Misp01_81450 [Microtetraspora sp. NBRC 13810]|uniref:vWA domain-containing protein n=1 Tax=Microtetraspora sp. NBRC 13810 TaxID=3030990 RepID=UPI0024A04769|nr:von Willebrand factor type A domain-containing protein [Microtetraspora sp. NBRC 13810]GLW13017.1 hypothetical protein Misp01_81450 [Microtetraspora sp. NBRC 13810]
MTSRPLVIVFAAATLLLLAACGGGAGEHDRGSPGKPAAQEAPGAVSGDGPDSAQISTFALDVDTASYGYARRTLQEGRRPDPGAVRVEEFVNAFRQDYAEPEGDEFAVHVDGARMPENDVALLRVGLQTRSAGEAARRPVSLTFVVDVSGSMAEPGRLDLVRSALHRLVDRLAPGDQVSIVAFSDEARVVAPMTPAGSRAALHEAIDGLAVEASTDLAAGLTAGYREASRARRDIATNRVVLLSDGLANTGVTAWQAILDQVEEHAGRKITLLCVGVGREYGDELMERLADNGDGAAVYVSSEEQAREVFGDRLTTHLELRARDAKAQVVFNPSVVESARLLGYENRALADEEFREDAVDGGEIGPGHSVTALYRVTLRPGARGQVAMASVRWQDPDTRQPAEISESADTGALAGSLWREAPARLQVAAVAATFAGHLRGDAGERPWRLDELAGHADRLAAETGDPAVTELAELIRRAGEAS